jgi:hypothetical protein
MKDGTIPQMTAVGPPDGSANDNEAAIAVHLDKLSWNTTPILVTHELSTA